MGFASAYLDERALFPQTIVEAPDRNTGIIVVVPAYNEPEIARLLDSLAGCTQPDCSVEVIIVINAPDDATAESIINNKECMNNIESWKKTNENCFFRLFAINVEEKPVSGWGVGLARKTGMDEAVRRFNTLNNPEGVILNVDADCTVEKNYFTEVNKELAQRCDRSACSIYFEHPLEGEIHPAKIYRYIALYELHLRYYFQGLALSGFPYIFHTVGSAIAVKAQAYVKAGGMNRKQAGEDFYFIQKLVPLGGYFSLNTTAVFPSPRPSFRVPFGTGASIGKLTGGNSDTLLTYNVKAFNELRTFFAMTENLFNCVPEQLHNIFETLPPGLKLFLDELEWADKMNEVRNNTSGLQSFKKRFFAWFNMFKIVKYLNYVHQEYFEKKPVEVSASELLGLIGGSIISDDPVVLLRYFRSLEKNINR
jgi:glycosyltransferase involved in cell wall biosynthesis